MLNYLREFQPINTWEPDQGGAKYTNSDVPLYIQDKTTGKRYLNETKSCIRQKSMLLSMGTPIIHGIASLVALAFRIGKLITLSHFWVVREGEQTYSFKGRLQDAGEDLLKTIFNPIIFACLELSAMYGIFNPHDGRKLYTRFELLQYGDYFTIAPCFRPDPKYHLAGGELTDRDVF